MAADHDQVLEYTDWRYPLAHGSPTRIRMRVWHLAGDDPAVVVLTELADNTGASVTNTIETAAELVYAFLREQGHANAPLVEHYPARQGREATFDVVTFNPVRRADGGFQQPHWRRIRPGELEQLIPAADAAELERETWSV